MRGTYGVICVVDTIAIAIIGNHGIVADGVLYARQYGGSGRSGSRASLPRDGPPAALVSNVVGSFAGNEDLLLVPGDRIRGLVSLFEETLRETHLFSGKILSFFSRTSDWRTASLARSRCACEPTVAVSVRLVMGWSNSPSFGVR